MCFCLRGFVCLFLLRNRICDTKKSWFVRGVSVLGNLSKQSSDCMLTEPRVIQFPRPEKVGCFQSSGAVDARLFPISMCSGTFQKQANPELPTVSPGAAPAQRRARAMYPSPGSLFRSLCGAAQRDHLPGSPVWPRCCSVCAALTSHSSQGSPAAAAAVGRAGDAQTCREVL